MSLSIHAANLALALQGFVLALVLVPLARRFGARYGFVDAVNPAKIHAAPMVRCGGLGIYLAFMLALGMDLLIARHAAGWSFLPEELRRHVGNVQFVAGRLLGLLTGATVLFVTGLVDDRVNLRPLVKLALQVLSAVPLIASGSMVRFFTPGWLPAALLTIAWVVLLTNAFNFMDNMNGLSSGVACMCALNFYFVSGFGNEYFMMAILALFIGSVLGFLPYNFPNARLFMGDSGSLFNGYMLAGLSIMVTYYEAGVPTQLPVVAPLVVLGVPLFDTASVLYIRWRNGKPLMQGDQNHFSHRLVALGFSRRDAVLVIYLVTLATGLSAVNLRHLGWGGALLALVQAALFFLVIFLLEQVARRRNGT